MYLALESTVLKEKKSKSTLFEELRASVKNL